MEYYLTSKIKQRYSVLKFDRNRDGNLFDSSNKASIISATEINLINLLIKKQIAVYNKKGQQVINKPEKYFKQIIAVVNSNGEKIVWVNCLCEVFTGQWKKTIPIVSDGGACYFSLKINLTQKRSYDFYVNGLA